LAPQVHARGRQTLPYAFTAQGVAMLSGVLHSKRAVEVNIAIMRAFVRLREILSSHKELARRLDELEKKVGQQDEKIHAVFEAIRQLMTPPPAPNKRRIGFATDTDEAAGPSQGTSQAKRRRTAKARQ
jgi:hypothetical protein